MKTIGLIGGTSWESTLAYYQILNELTNQKLGGLHSARCLLYSLDFQEVLDKIEQGEWGQAGAISSKAAQILEAAGAGCILLCANTAHKNFEQVQNSVRIPVLHIAQVVAESLHARGLHTVGLLGTRYTLGEDFYISYLRKEGIQVLIPEEESLERVNQIIYDELCKGIILDESRQALLSLGAQMESQGAEGLILGCTELGLILHDGDMGIPFFDTVKLHSEAAVRWSLS